MSNLFSCIPENRFIGVFLLQRLCLGKPDQDWLDSRTATSAFEFNVTHFLLCSGLCCQKWRPLHAQWWYLSILPCYLDMKFNSRSINERLIRCDKIVVKIDPLVWQFWKYFIGSVPGFSNILKGYDESHCLVFPLLSLCVYWAYINSSSSYLHCFNERLLLFFSVRLSC